MACSEINILTSVVPLAVNERLAPGGPPLPPPTTVNNGWRSGAGGNALAPECVNSKPTTFCLGSEQAAN